MHTIARAGRQTYRQTDRDTDRRDKQRDRDTGIYISDKQVKLCTHVWKARGTLAHTQADNIQIGRQAGRQYCERH